MFDNKKSNRNTIFIKTGKKISSSLCSIHCIWMMQCEYEILAMSLGLTMLAQAAYWKGYPKMASFWPRICKKSIFAAPPPRTSLGELMMLPRPSSWTGRGHPLHSSSISLPTAPWSRRRSIFPPPLLYTNVGHQMSFLKFGTDCIVTLSQLKAAVCPFPCPWTFLCWLLPGLIFCSYFRLCQSQK